MRNAPEKITLCLDLFYRGMSLRGCQSHLQSFYPHNSNYSTIYRWIVRYANMIHNFTDKLDLDVGRELQVDEMEYGSRMEKTHGWFIDSIDTTTRYMVASQFTKGRGTKELQEVIKRAKEKTGNQILICTTDGYYAYRKAIKSVFGYNKKVMQFNVKHNVVTQLKNEGFNHKIERLHNNIRARTKTFRGFGSLNGANSIMKGYEIFYNFIRKHQAINKCPYELATDLKFTSNNKWFELIEKANNI